MTGKHWEERGEWDKQRTSRRESNSGRCEHNCAICRCTNHEAIGADYLFIFNVDLKCFCIMITVKP